MSTQNSDSAPVVSVDFKGRSGLLDAIERLNASNDRLRAEVESEREVRKWRERRLVCPSGCGCIFPDDPDANECACDGLCCREEWNDLRRSLADRVGAS